VANHHLINAYLTAATARLPAAVVDELADGLTETYHRQQSLGLDPDAAAAAAIAEFGDFDRVLAAFVRQAPGRRTTRVLLRSGPAVGLCWGAALTTGHAWAWPIPVPVRVGVGLALIAVVATLAVAATGRRSYHRTRVAAAGGAVLIVLDAAALIAVGAVAPGFGWPLALAGVASLTRLVWTTRAVRRLIAH
jgi:hypothetical protein